MRQISLPVILLLLSFNQLTGCNMQEIKTQQDIQYGITLNDRNINQPLLMDIYAQDYSGKKKPVVILVHGGGFKQGDKKQELYIRMATDFAKAGFIAFSINYRLCSQEKVSFSALDNAIQDLLTAIRWIKIHNDEYAIDTTKIIVAGDSAGGAIAINAAYSQEGKNMITGCINMWGGLPFNRLYPDANQYGQPVNYYPVTGKNPPTYIIHGDHDKVIPVSTSRQLAEELKLSGVEHEIYILEGADHYPQERADLFIPEMIKYAINIIKLRFI